MVGLPDSAVKESHQRILSALQVTGYKMPTSNIVINMAPADIRKEGSSYDLPLAIGMLAAGETISCQKLSRYIMMGELSLDGTIQPIKGALPIAIKAREEGFDGLIVPSQNAREAAVVNNLSVYGVNNIQEVIEFINGKGVAGMHGHGNHRLDGRKINIDAAIIVCHICRIQFLIITFVGIRRLERPTPTSRT